MIACRKASMKHVLVLSILLLASAMQSSWSQIPRTISYQGTLAQTDGAIVPDGDYTLTFRIYDVDTGGTELWSEDQTLAIEKGIFNASLGSVNPLELDFDKPYWLGISVSNGAELVPRIALTASPYSLSAQSGEGDSSWTVSGDDIYRLKGSIGIGTTPFAKYKLSVDGNLKVTGELHARGIYTEYDKSYITVGNRTFLGWTTYPNWGNSKNNWHGWLSFNAYRLGTDPQGTWRQTDQDTPNWIMESRGGQIRYMYAPPTADPTFAPKVMVWIDGNEEATYFRNYVGIRTRTPSEMLTVNAFPKEGTGISFRDGEFHPTGSGGMGIVSRDHDGKNKADGLAMYSHDGLSFFTEQKERLRIKKDGGVHIKTDGSAMLEVSANRQDEQATTSRVRLSAAKGGISSAYPLGEIVAGYGGLAWADGYLGFNAPSVSPHAIPPERAMTIESSGNVYITRGSLHVKGVIEITGGADFSEQFEVRGRSTPDGDASEMEIKPGMVVCIDRETPGELVVSTKAYDHTVAGIISGAGGVKPGMLMSQTGTVVDGNHPVALTGRVYCLANASYGAVQPGDLLTTSDTPGHAMKVTDYNRAQGAILGKAMSVLEDGRGLVLVLVMPQ